MKSVWFVRIQPTLFGNVAHCSIRRSALWHSLGLLLLCSLLAAAALNILTNGATMSGSYWSLGTAPAASANAGSFQDLLIATSSNQIYQASGNVYAQSINITNGQSYTYVANTTNYSSGSPVLRVGDAVSSAAAGTSFSNSVSGVTNDAIYLANNSSLTILETNLNNATNSVQGNPLTVGLYCTNGQNFNIQSGSTLTINALIQASSSSKTITLTGGGTFNYGGNPYAPSNLLNNLISFKSSLTITNDSTFMLNGVISNGAGNGVVVASANSLFNENSTGTIQGTAILTVNSGLATLHGTNTYSGVTTVTGPSAMLEVFGHQALSGSSSLAQGSTTSLNSTLALATPDNYTMNQLQLSGIIIVTNAGSGPSTLTFTNGGYQTGTATKQIQAETNTTVIINGSTFDIIGASGNKDRNLNVTVSTGGAVTINAVLENTNGVITSAFNGGLEKHGHGVLTLNNVNTYTGGTTNSGGGTLMVNGQIGGFSVNSDSILGGTGTITSPIIITTNGTLAPGLTTAIGTLHASGGINLAGNVLIKVNKSVSPSNDLTQVTGALTNAGTGTITVTTNLPGATALALGDRFVIFSQAVSNGAAMTVIGSLPSGLAWSNNLATDGSISVVSGIVASPQLGVAQVGNVLTFTWSGAFKLQSQTNTLGVGLSNNWGDYPGGTSSGVTATINTANPAVFFRLSQ